MTQAELFRSAGVIWSQSAISKVRTRPSKAARKLFVVRMARLSQGLQGLRTNRVGRNLPKHDRKIALQVGIRGDLDRMRRQQRLAAARRQAQANVRGLFKSRQGPIRARFTDARLVHTAESDFGPSSHAASR
jgi:hypothetical protein